MKALIQKLAEAVGPSGYESAVRDLIRAEVDSLADEVRVDALGNLIVRKGQKGKKLMLAAHMDEIGLIATHIDENGFVRFTNVGGVYVRNLPGGRVCFLNGTPGVIGTYPADRLKSSFSLDKAFIDVGAISRKDCPVKVGDMAVFERPFSELGKRLVAKSLDDRAGVAVMIETLRRLKSTPYEVYFVFTVQEEIVERGAGPAAYGIAPDLALAVDVTSTGDTPEAHKMQVALGDGPAIKIRDQAMISDSRIVAWMTGTAEKAGLPYQREVLELGTTDARMIQVSRAGVPAGCLSLPCRYIHSPSEMIDYDDVLNAVKLLVALLSAPVPVGL
jgi:putative aminopeptidase FrvX